MKPGKESPAATVCVAIPTYLREKVLVDTLQQVLAQRPAADEVLVIDQTPEHEAETREYLARAEEAGQIRWIRHSPPNLNGARNRAIKETQSDILILIDDDVELTPSFIAKHRRNYDDTNVVAVCGRVLQARGNVPQQNQQPWLNQFNCKQYSGWDTRRVEGIAGLWGGNHSLRVETVRRFGGFDENFVGPLYNESDLALRLWKAGMLIVYDPEAELLHLGVSLGGVRGGKKRIPEYLMSFSALYFHLKHFFPKWYFWKNILFLQFRRSVLYKDNVFRPWYLPWAIVSYGYSFLLAVWLCARGRRLQSQAISGIKHRPDME